MGVIRQTSHTASVPIGVAAGNGCYEWSAGDSGLFVPGTVGVKGKVSRNVYKESNNRKYTALYIGIQKLGYEMNSQLYQIQKI